MSDKTGYIGREVVVALLQEAIRLMDEINVHIQRVWTPKTGMGDG